MGQCLKTCRSVYTCAYEEGEACVNGACEVPPADYCEFFVPSGQSDGRQPPMCIDRAVEAEFGSEDEGTSAPSEPGGGAGEDAAAPADMRAGDISLNPAPPSSPDRGALLDGGGADAQSADSGRADAGE